MSIDNELIDNGRWGRFTAGAFSVTTGLCMVRIKAVILLYRAIPFGVCKQTCNITEVHDSKMRLSVVPAQAGASADDLLKLGHGTYHLIQND